VENRKPRLAIAEELQGIVAGLTAVVKQQADAQKATSTEIAQLPEALLSHRTAPAAPATGQANSTPLQMPALQLPKFHYDHTIHDDIE